VIAGAGLGSIVIAVIYGGAIWLLRGYDGHSDWVPDPDPLAFPAPTGNCATGNTGLIWQAAAACFAILVFGLLPVLPADLLFHAGPVPQDTSRTVRLALAFGLAVTAIYLTGLLVRRKPRLGLLRFWCWRRS